MCECDQRMHGLSGCRHVRYPDVYPPPAEPPACPECKGAGDVRPSRVRLLALETHRMGQVELTNALHDLQDALLEMMLQEQADEDGHGY